MEAGWRQLKQLSRQFVKSQSRFVVRRVINPVFAFCSIYIDYSRGHCVYFDDQRCICVWTGDVEITSCPKDLSKIKYSLAESHLSLRDSEVEKREALRLEWRVLRIYDLAINNLWLIRTIFDWVAGAAAMPAISGDHWANLTRAGDLITSSIQVN